ncbi:MAG: hypothetical protein ABSE49_06825 [Polyangiaceae bacterium]|jgi:hypothetical protein
MPRLHFYPGGCHCGGIRVRLDSNLTPPRLGLRTDTCSFCVKQHARYTSDPGGELHLAFREADRVRRYRFGTRTADFLFCEVCGVFVAVVMPEARLGIVNVNALDARADFLALPLHTADFDAESMDERLARRRARWTPLRSGG